MVKNVARIPVIDLFAGAGGLGEGFSRYADFSGDDFAYEVNLSIEKNDAAAKTLRLRAFFRQFPEGSVPTEYYDYIRCTDPGQKERLLDVLRARREWRRSAGEVWKRALGAKDESAFFRLHRRIRRRVAGAERWVLLGGPPCQAYSVVGRARRLGDGRDLRLNLSASELEERRLSRNSHFFRDERHTLYTDYLEIVALHQPPVFVMENVKGILTSKLPNETDYGGSSAPIFDRIMRDMSDPWIAIQNEKLPSGWEAIADGRKYGYNLYSFTKPPNAFLGDNAPEEYLIQAEHHGIPQERHRVILLGIREDIDAVPRPLVPRKDTVSVRQIIGHMPPLRSGRSGRSEDGKRRDRSVDSPQSWADTVRTAVPDNVAREIEPEALRVRLSEIRTEIASNLSRGGAFIPWSDVGETADELGRWIVDRCLGGVIQHESRQHMDGDFARYLFAAAYAQCIGASPKLRHFPTCLLPKHQSVFKAGSETVQSRIFADRFRVQVAEKPASTIVSHISKDGHYYIHYDPLQCRSLTVREAARIQTFPDNYFFEGNRTEQYEQVGNAVPPYLAFQLAAVVADVFSQAVRKPPSQLKRKQRETVTV